MIGEVLLAKPGSQKMHLPDWMGLDSLEDINQIVVRVDVV